MCNGLREDSALRRKSIPPEFLVCIVFEDGALGDQLLVGRHVDLPRESGKAQPYTG